MFCTSPLTNPADMAELIFIVHCEPPVVGAPQLILGPVVNTTEDEAFPFFIDNTLYFTSNGHGGLGGLDIFQE